MQIIFSQLYGKLRTLKMIDCDFKNCVPNVKETKLRQFTYYIDITGRTQMSTNNLSTINFTPSDPILGGRFVDFALQLNKYSAFHFIVIFRKPLLLSLVHNQLLLILLLCLAL